MKFLKNWKIALPFTFIVVAVLFFVYFNNPNVENSILPECVIHKVTGLYCTGCGITRATYALLHGDFSIAFRQNALAFFLLPTCVVVLVYPKIFYVKYFPHILLFIIVAFTVLRNFEMFWFLAPF